MVQEVSCLGEEVDVLEAEVLLELLENQKTQVLGGLLRRNQSWFQSGGGKTCSAGPQLSKDHGIEEQGKVYWHPRTKTNLELLREVGTSGESDR